MDKNNYKNRLVDAEISTYLKAMGAICIEGPKWCGKTWTSRYHANSEFLLGDPSGNFSNRNLAQTSPALILEGETPRLIDEWQEVPQIWDAVRYLVDDRGKQGQMILTGSATPQFKGTLHSGAGRIARIRMRTMSLFEAGKSTGLVSLNEIYEDRMKPVLTGEPDLNLIMEHIIRGGWPQSQDMPMEIAEKIPMQYIKAVIEDDINKIDGINRNKKKIELLLRSLARNESTMASIKTLIRDIKEVDDDDIDKATVSSYLDVLERLFLIDNIKPFSGKLRSPGRIKQAEKRHLADPSLACALMGANKKKLLEDFNTLGFLFEALCERDLRIYGQSIGAKIYHYQDYSGKELDAVLEFPNGDWVAVEIKLGADRIEEAAQNILNIKNKIQNDGGKVPKVGIVICGLEKAAYKRPDGVYVVPITALKD